MSIELVRVFTQLKKDRTCARFGIPKRLWTRRRLKDNDFADEELIYRRFKANLDTSDWSSTKGLSTSIFNVDNDSTNRSKYSIDPRDVLHPVTRRNPLNHYQSYGVVSFSVRDFKTLSIVPKEPLRLNGVLREFTFHLEHKPVCCMYPHTEIWIMENGNQMPVVSSRMVKTAVRDELIRIIDVAQFPV